MKALAAAAVGSLVLVAVLGLARQPPADAQVSRVVDRTLLCRADLSGGIYEVEVRAQAGSGRRGSSWQRLPTVGVNTGSVTSVTEALDSALAWATAGNPARSATVIQDPFGGVSYPVRAWGTVALSTRCRTSRARPALSSSGLQAQPVDALGALYDCPSPRQVLVRTRSVLSAPSELRTRRGFLATVTPATESRLVVATTAGRRLAYADAVSGGRARLFTGPSCVRE